MLEKDRLLNVQNCMNMQMRRSTRILTDFYNACMKPSGLHANQFALLVPPFLKPGMTISELAEFSGLDRTTLARNLKVLEDRQLVGVQVGNDQRTRVIHVTEQGQQVVGQALPLWEQAQAQVIERLGATQLDQLYNVLSQLEELG